MPTIISIAHQKGGVGKTTLALNLYAYFTQSGINCGIVDTDAQGSIVHLHQALGGQPEWDGFNLIELGELSDFKSLQENEDYDLIILDTPPYLSSHLEEIIGISDYVLVPCKASPLDALAVAGTVQILEKVWQKSPNIKAGVVINMAIPNSSFNEQIKSLLADHSVPILNTMIGNRVDYCRSMLFSHSVNTKENKKAKAEIAALAEEILAHLTQNDEEK